MPSSVETPATEVGQKEKVLLRWMLRQDLPQVTTIEKMSFPKGRWEEDDFLLSLRQRHTIGHVGVVATPDSKEKVVAFFVYEIHQDHLQLINLAVHPEYRGRGIGEQVIHKLQSKVSDQRRTHIVAVVPQSCPKALPFFKKYEPTVIIRLSEMKGYITRKPKFSAMTLEDADEVQVMENDVLREHGRSPRNIIERLTKHAYAGIIARDESDHTLMGYVFYQSEGGGISVGGEFGVIVGSEFRKRGLGRALLGNLLKLNLPITFCGVCLTCRDQAEFLRAVGVPVPQMQAYINVAWRPTEA